MAKMFNRARMSVSSTGTGTLTLNGPVLGYQSFATAGVANGDTVSYVIEDGANFEFGTGTYTSAGTTLSRTVTQSYNGTTYGTSPISVTTSAQVFITALAADLTSAANITSGTLGVANGGTGLSSLTAGRIPYGNGTSAFGNSSNLFWDAANVRLGIGSASPVSPLNISSNAFPQFVIQDNQTNSTVKYAMFGVGHYLNAQLPAAMISAQSTSSDNTVHIGGAYVQMNAATTLKFFTATNTTTTAGAERMAIDSSGRVGIGSSPNASTIGLTLGGTATGGTVIFQQYLNYTVASDVTAFARGIVTNINTIASAFTLSNLEHYYAGQGTIGAGSAITNQIGYRAAANLIGATYNYGFYGDIPSGTNRWNFYAAGTADNYFAGNVGIGTTGITAGYGSGKSIMLSNQSSVLFQNASNTWNQTNTGGGVTYFSDNCLYIDAKDSASAIYFRVNGANERMRIDSAGLIGIASTTVANTQLQIGGTAPTAGTASYGINIQQTIPSGSTAVGVGYCTTLSTQAASFTCGSLIHFNASQSTIGAGSTVTNQYGFIANSNITGATNNYAFFGNIPSGTGRWNFYAAGTADNYFAGNVGIGVAPAQKLDVNGSVALRGSTSGSITLTAKAVAGSNTLTLPASTGTISTTGFAVAMSVVFGG